MKNYYERNPQMTTKKLTQTKRLRRHKARDADFKVGDHVTFQEHGEIISVFDNWVIVDIGDGIDLAVCQDRLQRNDATKIKRTRGARRRRGT